MYDMTPYEKAIAAALAKDPQPATQLNKQYRKQSTEADQGTAVLMAILKRDAPDR